MTSGALPHPLMPPGPMEEYLSSTTTDPRASGEADAVPAGLTDGAGAADYPPSPDLSTAEIQALDRAHLFHPATHMRDHAAGHSPNRIITGADGVYIWDSEGRRTLDAFAGLFCVNVGYGRDHIAQAIGDQARQLAYYHIYAGHGSEPAARLAARLAEKAPEDINHVFFGLSGSDANETVIKLLWYMNNIEGKPERKKIIARHRGYHGAGIMTGSLSGVPLFQTQFDLPKPPVVHTTCPHWYRQAQEGESELAFSQRCARELEALIQAEGPDTIAAFIGEPVLGTGGIVPPPQGYWDAIQPVLKRHGILLVADEVITAFGRLGHWFGCEAYGIKPDIITIAKGLTSGYLPLSGVMVSDAVWAVLEDGSAKTGPIGHGWTYAGHPTCIAAANANLDILEAEDLPARTREMAPYLMDRLQWRFAGHPIVGEIRGAGLMAAIEFSTDPANRTPFDPELSVGRRISAACLERNVIARGMPQTDALGFCPPLCITEEEIDQVVEVAGEATDAVAQELGYTP